MQEPPAPSQLHGFPGQEPPNRANTLPLKGHSGVPIGSFQLGPITPYVLASVKVFFPEVRSADLRVLCYDTPPGGF